MEVICSRSLCNSQEQDAWIKETSAASGLRVSTVSY